MFFVFAKFLVRIGIEQLREVLVDDSLNMCARLDKEIQKAVDAYQDPWKEADSPAYPNQFSAPERKHTLELTNNND